MGFRHFPLAGAAALAITFSTAAQPALAQQAALEEIVVTARKRDESLQEIPLSITAFGVQSLRQRNIATIYDLAAATPNYAERKQLGRRLERPIIRGQAGTSVFGEPNASYFIDGVYISGGISSSTFDALERVEIIRGPQSALFGRATFAGAVNLITRQPSNQTEGQINLRVGSDDDRKLSGWFSGPIAQDRLFVFASVNWEQYGGEWRNGLLAGEAQVPGAFIPFPPPGRFTPFFVNPPQQGDDSPLGGEQSWDATVKLVYVPSSNHEFAYKFTYSGSDDDHFPSLLLPNSAFNCYRPGDPGAGFLARGYFCGEVSVDGLVSKLNLPDFREGASTFFGTAEPAPFIGKKRDQFRNLLQYEGNYNDWTLVGRYTWNRSTFEDVRDLDRSPARAVFGLFHAVEDNHDEDWAAELRLASPQARALRALFGLYYLDYKARGRDRRFTGPGFDGYFFHEDGSDFDGREVTNMAAFGFVEYDFSEQFTLALEGRYAEDEKSVFNATISITDDTKIFTPRITATYRPGDALTLYALAAKGDKPLDFNQPYFDADVAPEVTQQAVDDGRAIIKEEIAWTYELGLKRTLAGGRGLFNVSVFYIDWDNQSLNSTVLIPVISGPEPEANNVVVSAPEAEVWGLELELSWAATDRLLLGAGYGLAAHEFKSYRDLQAAALFGSDGDLSGNTTAGTPRHTLNLSATYRGQVNADIDWVVRAFANYHSKLYASSLNLAFTDSVEILNLNVGLEAGNWSLTAFLDNALDEDAPINIGRFADFLNPLLPNGMTPYQLDLIPRRGASFGLRASYSF